MNCTKCGQPLDEGALYCTACGNQHAVNEQRAKVNAAAANLKGVLSSSTKNLMFLIFSIAFSAMTASTVISAFSGGFSGILSNALNLVFMIIATVGLWKCYLAKDNVALVSGFRSASIYDAFNRVMWTISIVFTSIGFAIAFILTIAGGDLFADIFDEDAFSDAGIVVALVILLIAAVVIAVMVVCRGIFAHRRQYFLALSKAADSGEYKAAKAPVIGSYILGGVSALSAIGSFSSAGLTSDIADFFEEFLGDDLGELISGPISDAAASMIIGGIASLILAAYYIVSAIWMTSVHEEQVASNKALVAEINVLSEIEAATKEAIIEHDAAQRRADEAAARKNQATMQEQQMMMQMMMQQMMANGMNVNNAAAAAPVVNTDSDSAN